MMAASFTAAGTQEEPAEGAASVHPGLRVALAQIPLEDGDLARNMQIAEDAARATALHKPDILCLPEAADFGWLHQEARALTARSGSIGRPLADARGSDQSRDREGVVFRKGAQLRGPGPRRDALPIPGQYTEFLAKLAVRHRLWVCAGCLEKDGDRAYNSAVILDRAGRIVLKHRKIRTLPDLTKHLYDAGSLGGLMTADTEFGRIGLTICADNFDIAIPQRAAQAGAWLLITPHGFAAPANEMEKNALAFQEHIRRIAAKTGMWVAGTNVVLARVRGGAWKDQMHCGCSTVARPDGTAAVVGKFKQADLIVYDIPAA